MKKRLVLNSFLILFILPIALELFTVCGIISFSPSRAFIELCFKREQPQYDYVEFLDVGQGDCTIIKSENAVAVIDFGVEDDADKIYKSLLRKGIKEIDLAVITHHHRDHMGGFIRLAKKIKIKSLIINNNSADDGEKELYKEIISLAKSRKINLILPTEGECFEIGGATLKILSFNSLAEDENNRSVISMVDICGKSILFTGDCDDESEFNLAQKCSVKCDVLKMGHHGSKNSSSSEFLKAANPEIAVASCGYDNGYNHPAATTLARFDEQGITVYRTDLDQSIRIAFKKAQNSIEVYVLKGV